MYAEQEETGDMLLVLLMAAFSLYVLGIGFAVSFVAIMTDRTAIGRTLFALSILFSSLLVPFLYMFIRKQWKTFVDWRRTHFHVQVFENRLASNGPQDKVGKSSGSETKKHL
jgi:hypothetical protein